MIETSIRGSVVTPDLILKHLKAVVKMIENDPSKRVCIIADLPDELSVNESLGDTISFNHGIPPHELLETCLDNLETCEFPLEIALLAILRRKAMGIRKEGDAPKTPDILTQLFPKEGEVS